MKVLRDCACTDIGRPDVFVHLVTQFITQLNTTCHCAGLKHHAVLNYTYSLPSIFYYISITDHYFNTGNIRNTDVEM